MFGISALTSVIGILRNPLVLAAIGLVAVGLYGAWKKHEGVAQCNARWERVLAEKKAEFMERVAAANAEAARTKAEMEERAAALRQLARKLEKQLDENPDCNLSDADLDRLRELR